MADPVLCVFRITVAVMDHALFLYWSAWARLWGGNNNSKISVAFDNSICHSHCMYIAGWLWLCSTSFSLSGIQAEGVASMQLSALWQRKNRI